MNMLGFRILNQNKLEYVRHSINASQFNELNLSALILTFQGPTMSNVTSSQGVIRTFLLGKRP